MHNLLINVSLCVFLPVFLCRPVVCGCVWTIQLGVRIRGRVVFTPYQQRAPESHAPPHRGRNRETLAGSVRDPGDLESARKELETSLDQHSAVKCNSCYFCSTHTPGTQMSWHPQQSWEQKHLVTGWEKLVAKLGS